MHKHTDPRISNLTSKLIMAENDLDEVIDNAGVFARDLPTKSAAALAAAVLGKPLPADLPECERVDFERRFLDRIGRLRSTIAHLSDKLGVKS